MLDINDNSPVFLDSSPTAEVSENATFNIIVLTLEADDDDIGENARLDFSIVDQGAVGGLEPFRVRTFENFAEIFLNDSSAIDYETQTAYIVRLAVRDGGSIPLMNTIDIRINVLDVDDNDPTFPQPLYTATISETAPINFFVLSVLAEDPDSVTNFAHQIQGNTTNAFFYINATTGDIFLQRPLNHENAHTHYLIVETFNLDSPAVITDSTNVTIYVSDENDLAPFFLAISNENLDEGSYQDELIVTLTLVDLDVNHMAHYVEFTLLTESERFYITQDIDPANSSISFANLFLTGDVDFESQPLIAVTIRALDDNTTSAQSAIATVFIYLNNLDDEPPVFDQELYEATVNEGSLAATIVTAVHADDPDVGVILNYGLFQRIFPINAAPFEINSQSGVIQVFDDGSVPIPDFEAIKYYTLGVSDVYTQSVLFSFCLYGKCLYTIRQTLFDNCSIFRLSQLMVVVITIQRL